MKLYNQPLPSPGPWDPKSFPEQLSKRPTYADTSGPGFRSFWSWFNIY